MNEETLPPVKYASFNSRVIASALDIFIIMIFTTPVVDFILAKIFPPVNMEDFMSLATPETVQDIHRMLVSYLQVAKEKHLFQRAIFQNLLQIVFVGLYTLPFWFKYSSTPGKMLMRIAILDENSGERMTHRQAYIRFLGYIVSFLPLTLGFMWIAFNKKRQGFHDLIAKTVVIVKPKEKKKKEKRPD